MEKYYETEEIFNKNISLFLLFLASQVWYTIFSKMNYILLDKSGGLGSSFYHILFLPLVSQFIVCF